jgi:misacylated tRNA(Ala) deacylase
METELLYYYDSYLKEFKAKIVDIFENKVALDKTAFYPEGGGQPADFGSLTVNDKSIKVINTLKDGDLIYHIVDPPLDKSLISSTVQGTIDWGRRYAHMRHHTAIHILSGVLFQKYNAKITGSQINVDKARMDINYEQLNRELLPVIEANANEIVKKGLPVNVKFADPKSLDFNNIVRVKLDLLPEKLETVRLIDIEGFDYQADGGTHVKNTSEVGTIKIVKYESKGKANKRIYIILE